MDLTEKLKILTDAAKYDVSCSSSGSQRPNTKGGLGNAAPAGICHSWSADGRCISLLKILLTNYCAYDCDYCINRRSNDIPRASFTVEEVVDLTINFYRRNYIEGLFLSSGILQSPDRTMEMLLGIARRLRERERFNGYIHMKAIPGASKELIDALGLYVDRMSINIELPTSQSLNRFAPDKTMNSILTPMKLVRNRISESELDRQSYRHAPLFVPAGQTTQMIIGAGGETDHTILQTSQSLYHSMSLKRVYYSAFVPVGTSRLLAKTGSVPLAREHRIYQADFLMRFYKFKAEDLLSEDQPYFDPHLDPKAVWALRHPELFPMEINDVSYEDLLKIPGIGVVSAKRIVASRRFARLGYDDLKKMGIVLKRARYFLIANGHYRGYPYGSMEELKNLLLKDDPSNLEQLSLFAPSPQKSLEASHDLYLR